MRLVNRGRGAKLQSIKPGVTTREEILKTFGEPRSISASRDFILHGEGILRETFSYYRLIGGYSYYDTHRSEMLSIHFTNGVVQSFYKSE